VSVQAMTYAFEQEGLATGEKFLLVAIGNSCDEAGVAYPGHELLARRTGTSRETVSRNMCRLEAVGEIARRERRRANGSRTSDWIVLAPQKPDRAPMVDADPAEYPEEIAKLARASCDESSRDVDGDGHVTFSGGPEPSEEPSVKTPPTPPGGLRRRRRRTRRSHDLEVRTPERVIEGKRLMDEFNAKHAVPA
jgi:hypothetical protein